MSARFCVHERNRALILKFLEQLCQSASMVVPASGGQFVFRCLLLLLLLLLILALFLIHIFVGPPSKQLHRFSALKMPRPSTAAASFNTWVVLEEFSGLGD